MLIAVVIIVSGCIEPEKPQQVEVVREVLRYVCPDGTTIVSNITMCPKREYVCPDMRTIVDDPASCPREEEKEDDSAVCDKLSTGTYTGSYSNIRDQCYFGFAISKSDGKLCLKVIDSYTRASCFSTLAMNLNNMSICDLAGGSKDDCYEALAGKLKDPSVCAKITSRYDKDTCYLNMVYTVREESICLGISSQQTKDSCYSTLAYYTYNSEYCSKITSVPTQDTCLTNLAYYKNDVSLCNELSTPAGVKNCIAYINRTKNYYGSGYTY
ncbi:MAG: hypothetical protein PHG85_04425 [Candidatus Altiarchaeota archaeon]|nr:hypothetical protein [Candidatus Altiarchaeota archaeon]